MRNNTGIQMGMKEFVGWLSRLFRQPVFLFVTFWGHASILLGAASFHHFEAGSNPKAEGYFTAYYWAISTAMTVGGADIFPVTTAGKVTAILLMMTGSLFLWSYAALFAASVVLPTMREFNREVRELEREVRVDQATAEKLLKELEELNRERKGLR